MLSQSFFSLMPTFVSLFWAVLLMLDKRRNLPKKFMVVFLLISFINYFTHASFFLFEYKLYAFLDNFWVFTSLAGYPFFYYYIRLLTHDEKINWRWLWILIPAFLLSLFSFVLYFLMSEEELKCFILNYMYHKGENAHNYSLLVNLQVLRTKLFKGIYLIQVVLVVVYSFRLLTRYNKRLTEFYSNVQERDLSQFKLLIFALLFASAVSSVSNLIGKDFFIDKGQLVALPSILHSIVIYWVAFAGFNQHFTISDFRKDIEEYRKQKRKQLRAKNAEQSVSDNDLSEKEVDIAKLLVDMVVGEKLFTHPDLRISDLALRLNTNRSYISRTVNEVMNTDFCSWVNNHRVEHAKELMSDPHNPNFSLEKVAEESGFSNLTTFYRVFKKHTKQTPGEYLKNL